MHGNLSSSERLTPYNNGNRFSTKTRIYKYFFLKGNLDIAVSDLWYHEGTYRYSHERSCNKLHSASLESMTSEISVRWMP